MATALLTINMTNSTHLPRLLYIGDVPVESTVAGSALLYRLLQEYPVQHLYIVEAGVLRSNVKSRIANVSYRKLGMGIDRLFQTRFAPLLQLYLLALAGLNKKRLHKIVTEFKPETILTVTHGYSWMTAYLIAKQFQLPLNLILHDDWLSSIHLPTWLKKKTNNYFEKVYQSAHSRLCVSPYMAESYQAQFKSKANILYPSRASDAPYFTEPPNSAKSSGDPFVFAFAGSILSGYEENLRMLASALDELGHKLIVFSAVSDEFLKRTGLNQSKISFYQPVSYQKLIFDLRNEADILFIPMSFDVKHKENMQLSFPSKFTDYTATGLPILIWGPSYSSAVRFANDNSGFAAVVNTNDVNSLKKALINLTTDQEYRLQLASKSIEIGRKYFAYETLVQNFYSAICG